MKNEVKTTEIKKEEFENNVKVGHFQLQTKSFWITLVTILTLFLLAEFILMMHFNMKIVKSLTDQNIKLIQLIQEKK